MYSSYPEDMVANSDEYGLWILGRVALSLCSTSKKTNYDHSVSNTQTYFPGLNKRSTLKYFLPSRLFENAFGLLSDTSPHREHLTQRLQLVNVPIIKTVECPVIKGLNMSPLSPTRLKDLKQQGVKKV